MTTATTQSLDAIQKKWQSYKTAILQPEAGNINMVLAELLFYGGATAAMSVVNDLFQSDLPPEEVVGGLERLSQEVLTHDFPGLDPMGIVQPRERGLHGQ